MQNTKFVVVFTILAFVLGGLFYLFYPTPNEYESPGQDDGEQVFCTADAMMCPDGSYVGREGPNCEFKACPIPNDAVMEDGTIPE
jgi:hypothetical protein